MNFDMNTVWSRSVELIRDNFQLLLIIGGVFLLFPTIVIYLLVPDMQTLADPTAPPEAVMEQFRAFLLPMIGMFLVLMLIQFVGYSAMVALMGDKRPTVGEALKSGIMSVPSLIAVMILFALAYFIGSFIILVPFSLVGAATGSAALGIIGIMPVLLFVIWLMARMSLIMPAIVIDGILNPFKAIVKSFQLTNAKQWQIMLFWFVIFAIMFIVSLILNGIVGVFAALLGTGTASMLIVGLVSGSIGMVSGMVTCAIAVAMHTQLSGPSVADIEDTFE